jgi:flagellar motor switch protein FliM
MNPDSPTPDPAAPPNPFVESGQKTPPLAETEAVPAVAPAAAPGAGDVHAYDFRNPMLLPQGELRKLRLHQEEFIQAAAARLSIHLRSEFSLTLRSLETVAFQKLAKSWGHPSHLTLFKMEPLRGVSVLQVSAQLGLCMVDRQMGGPGQASQTDQEISEIEKVLLEQTGQLFLEEWCGHWSGLKELKPSILGYESSGSFIRAIPPETMMLVVSMEAVFGECKGQIQMGVPYAAMEPLIHRFSQGAESLSAPALSAAPAPAAGWKWNPCFNDVCVPVTAEWEGLEMTAREILALKIGDVLPMDARRMQKINVRVADMLKFQGRPGTLAGQWAVELTQAVNP